MSAFIHHPAVQTYGAMVQAAPVSEFDNVVRILRSRRRLIVAITFVVVALATCGVMIVPSRYVSSAAVILDQRKNTIADLTSVLSALPNDPASLQNQIQILQSRDLAAQVIEKLKLYDDPEFNAAAEPTVGGLLLKSIDPRKWLNQDPIDVHVDHAVERDAIIDSFLSHLSAEAVGLSTSITVTFTSRDAHKAAIIADNVARTYVENQVVSKVQAAQATSDWLSQRLKELAAQLQVQQAAVLTYKAENNLDSSPGGTSLVDAQLGGINTQLVQARADLAAKLAIYSQVEGLVKSGNAANISQVVASPLIVQLRGQQAELTRQDADMVQRYGERNPKRIAVETQLADLNRKIGEEVARIAAALANDVAVARAQVGSLQASLIMTQHQASSEDRSAVKLQALMADVASTRNLYDSYLGRLHAIQDQDGLQYPEARVISHAPVAGSPTSPPRALIIAASLPVGILIGILVVLLAERLARNTTRPRRSQHPTVPRRAAAANAPLLADIPGAQAAGAADYVIDWPTSPFSLAISALLRRVAGPARKGSGRVVCVAAAEQGTAATSIAVALARAAAKSGLRTLLMDGDLTKPVIGYRLGIHPKVGLLDVLRGSISLGRALVSDPRSRVLVLSDSRTVYDPAEALSGRRPAALFAEARRLADLIIIAAPPVTESRETPFLTRVSDVVVVVANPAAGPQSLVSRALQALGEWNSPPVGMVLAR